MDFPLLILLVVITRMASSDAAGLKLEKVGPTLSF
jgi:hypothetical protein